MMALNQNLVKIETSKAFTPLEKQVIGKLHRLVYNRDETFYKKTIHDHSAALGIFCSGGSVTNITSLWIARNRLLKKKDGFNGIRAEGIHEALKHYNLNGLAVLISKRGHYSFCKAADLLGIGKRHTIAVATDADNKICLDTLKKEIGQLRESRIGIIAIVGIAGTTETGTVDPLDKLADICEETGCHFHVDAAWGGPTLFSEKYRHLLKGIERADSICFDAHKQLYIPVGASVGLFKDHTAVSAIEQHAHYVNREGSRDLGKHTLEGSRLGMAMLVHSGLRIIGRKGYELLINEGIEKTKHFAETIKRESDFELITEPQLNLLTYRYVPHSLKEKLNDDGKTKTNEILNELTMNIQRHQRAAGKSFVSRTTLEPQKYNGQRIVVFRIVLANPLTTLEVLKNILIEQREIAGRLLEDN